MLVSTFSTIFPQFQTSIQWRSKKGWRCRIWLPNCIHTYTKVIWGYILCFNRIDEIFKLQLNELFKTLSCHLTKFVVCSGFSRSTQNWTNWKNGKHWVRILYYLNGSLRKLFFSQTTIICWWKREIAAGGLNWVISKCEGLFSWNAKQKEIKLLSYLFLLFSTKRLKFWKQG